MTIYSITVDTELNTTVIYSDSRYITGKTINAHMDTNNPMIAFSLHSTIETDEY